MSDLVTDLKKKITKLFKDKRYSEIETELEKIGDLEKQAIPNINAYAVAKALNKNSEREDLVKAAYFFEKVYISDKSNLETLYNLALVSIRSRVYKYALPHLLERHKVNNKDHIVLEALSKINFVLGNISESNTYAHQLIKVNPGYLNGWEDYLSSLNYIAEKSQDHYLKYALEFNKLPKINCEPLLKKKNKTPSEKIKLGLLSPDFKTHSVSFFLNDTLSKISKNEFELFSFSNLEKKNHDNMTNAIKKSFDHWYDTKELSDIEFTNLVRSLDVDILIDLAGYTVGNRIQALRVRCAPIQVSWLGYCNTLGSDSIDYIIADRNLIKKEEEGLYVEKILYLPNIWNAMSKPKNLPSINELPAKNNSIFTLGSFNNFSKISSETIKVWSEILNNSNSRLILKSGSIEGDGSRENIKKKFQQYVHEENKILLLDRSKTTQEHLSEYNKIDLALDTFPFPGVTTTYEALLMGVPVLTMKGFNFNSRCGESINLNLKMNEFLADTTKDYVNKAITVQGNLNKLASLRSSLREITLGSFLFDTETFAKELSNILKETWNKTI